jgi:hypothetical protein
MAGWEGVFPLSDRNAWALTDERAGMNGVYDRYHGDASREKRLAG